MRHLAPIPSLFLLFLLDSTPPKVEPAKSGTATVIQQDIPPTSGAVRITIVTTPKLTDEAVWSWDYPDSIVGLPVVEEANKLVVDVPPSPEVTYSFKWTSKEPKQKQVVVRTKVKAGHGPQPPPEPVDPVNPPTPPDPSKPAPIEGDGLRFMCIYRDEDFNTYSPDQRAVVNGKKFRDYLEKNCAAGDSEKPDWKGYRIWPEGTNTEGDNQRWVKAFARPRAMVTSAPWIIVSNGKTGYEGACPATTAETKALMAKYGFKE